MPRPSSPSRPTPRPFPTAAALVAALAVLTAHPAPAQQSPDRDAAPAATQPVSPLVGGALRQGVAEVQAPDGRPELAIYADDRALVREVLRLEVAAGTDTVRWTDAPNALDLASLSLTFSGSRAPEVLETVHRPAATGPGAALSGLTGRVIAVRTEEELHRGQLVSSEGGAVTLRTGDDGAEGDGGEADEIVVVPVEGIESYRLPGLAPGFRAASEVAWTVRSEHGGERRAEVSYLTGRTGWDAEYVLQLGAEEDRLSLEGWAVLRNGTDRTWEDARVKLVAGDVGREDGARPEMMQAVRAQADAVGGPEQRAVGDFHVYELPRPVTLEAGTTVRSLLLRAEEVPVRRIYRVEGGGTGRWPPSRPITGPGFGPDHAEEHAAVVLALANVEASGLGRPLPAGRVRVYRRDDDGGLLLAGADRIGDTPAGDSLRLETARAFDVVSERTVTDFRGPGSVRVEGTLRAMEEDVRVELRNAKDEPVTVQVVEKLIRWTEWEVVDPRVDGASASPERLDAGRVLWRVGVPAGGSAALTYTARYTWSPEAER